MRRPREWRSKLRVVVGGERVGGCVLYQSADCAACGGRGVWHRCVN